MLLCILLTAFNCSDENRNNQQVAGEAKVSEVRSSGALLQKLDPSYTGISFTNQIVETNDRNYILDEYMYNGAGVAIADFNNDGLPEVFFTGNQVPNRLYLNKGGMKFEDITEKAGVAGSGWHNGVAVADVNADGNLDIYICRANSQETDPEKRRNLLFINDGKANFREQGKKYGVDDPGFSLNAAFIDYDKDGDLDLYVTNYPTMYDLTLEQVRQGDSSSDPFILDRFYRNNGNESFTEISEEVGVDLFGHGLGLGVGDLNNDGYPDIYVANDYATDDFLLINQNGQRFEQKVKDKTKHTSLFSMGLDINDFNNDGYLDLVVADMNPEDNFRSKATMPSMNPEAFFASLERGFHAQWMRNALHMNSDIGIFSEIGQMAGIARTDWSWSPLFLDVDNDGYKDLFISNGLMRDVDEKDKNKELKKMQKEKGGTLLWEEIQKKLNSTRIQNYWYRNNGDLTFARMNDDWNATEETFSNGAAYGDLDNDGDLDMVINNVNDPALIYQNNAANSGSNGYVKVLLKGPTANPFGYGARVTIETVKGQQMQEIYASRGYMSSSEPKAFFGVGGTKMIDKIIVDWPEGSREVLENVDPNQTIVFDFTNANLRTPSRRLDRPPSFRDVSGYTELDFLHRENLHDDYDKQVLLPHEMSKFGPALAVGDLNGDGFEDVYIGGAADQSGQLYLQNQQIKFTKVPGPWELDASKEDVDAEFFDLEGDGDLDLYVVSGGFAFAEGSSKYQDRLYVNDGQGMKSAPNLLPDIGSSGGCVTAADFDRDGDTDLFVGGRVVPDKYPYAPESYLLVNEGGILIDKTDAIAPGLRNAGMIADAQWVDLNTDGQLELVLAGDWTNVMVFGWTGSRFEDVSNMYRTDGKVGWWNVIHPADLDGDGDMDLVCGNLGLNYKYQASDSEPFRVYCDDFDGNGTYDIVLGFYQSGKEYPVRGLQCSSEQMPFVKENFPKYNEFAKASVEDIYGEKLKDALTYEANEFKSGIYWNDGGNMRWMPLPQMAQISAVMGVATDDFNSDGKLDIALAGNLMVAEVETGNADASLGLVLIQEARGEFKPLQPGESGFIAPNDVRDITIANRNSRASMIIIANNNERMQAYGYQKNVQ
jgi:hypothetical protein